MLSDSEIVKGCISFKRAAQKELYDRYINKMNAVCRRYISDKDELKDVIQDGFIKVFENINKYREDGPLEAWVKRIMVNTAISQIRKKKNDIFVKLDQTDQDLNYDTQEDDTDSIFHSDLSRDDLMAAINTLPENYKIVFNLYCIENYSHKEIADMLSLKEESSRSRLNRARKILKDHLLKIHLQRLSKQRN